MVEYAQTRVARAARRREIELEVRAFLRRLDWMLLFGVAALVGIGLWSIAGITRDDVPGDPRYVVNRQAVFAALGTVGLVVALLVDPDR